MAPRLPLAMICPVWSTSSRQSSSRSWLSQAERAGASQMPCSGPLLRAPLRSSQRGRIDGGAAGGRIHTWSGLQAPAPRAGRKPETRAGRHGTRSVRSLSGHRRSGDAAALLEGCDLLSLICTSQPDTPFVDEPQRTHHVRRPLPMPRFPGLSNVGGGRRAHRGSEPRSLRSPPPGNVATVCGRRRCAGARPAQNGSPSHHLRPPATELRWPSP